MAAFDPKLTALLVNDPLPGIPEKREAAILDRPWPMNSWLPLIFSPLELAIDLEMERASTNPKIAIAMAAEKISRTISKLRGKWEKGGSVPGIVPMSLSPED